MIRIGKIKEIEKKYLIYEKGKDFSTPQLKIMFESVYALKDAIQKKGKLINQGYLPAKSALKLAQDLEIKLDFEINQARLRNIEGTFYVTYKGKGDVVRDEVEQEIIPKTFEKYWKDTKGKRVDKIRLELKVDKIIYDFDYFIDYNLILLDVEVPSESLFSKLKPMGVDVTGIDKYKNPNLAR